MKMEIVKLLHMYKRDYPDKCLELTLPEDLNILFTEIKNQDSNQKKKLYKYMILIITNNYNNIKY